MGTVGRRQLVNPDLNTAGGSSLETLIDALYGIIGDDSPGRWVSFSALANSSTTTVEHDFGVPVTELQLYVYTGTYPALTRASGWSFVATSGHTKTKIDITAPGSGGPFTGYFWILHVPAAGSGGAGLSWHQPYAVGSPYGPAPVDGEWDGVKVWKFGSGAAQQATAVLKVPQGYKAGNQISVRIGHFSPASSGTGLMQTTAYLCRANTDAVGSTTNSHASGNAAVTNTVANQYREVVCDLTDSAGLVNGVAVSPGDQLLVILSRPSSGGSEDSQDISFLPDFSEVTLS